MPAKKKTSNKGNGKMRDAYIVSVARTAVGRALRGTLKDVRPEDIAAAAIKGAISKVNGLTPDAIDDLLLGCAMPEGPQGMNVTRIAGIIAGLPVEVPAATINRFCSSGLQTIALAAQNIMCGFNDIIIAGGVESMSMVPMGGFNLLPHPGLLEINPESFMPMGNTAEVVAERFNVSREDQDRFAYESHMKAIAAQNAGKFTMEIVPMQVKAEDGSEITFDKDECPRHDTTIEALAKLRPVFKTNGTVTAGNASPVNDGAAAVVVMSEEMVKKYNVKPLALFRNFQVAGVAPEIMGIGPVEAIPKLLRKAGLKLADIDLIELNEAFAAQAVACVKLLELDPAKVNVNGGAIALGHPLGGTGAILTCKLLNEMKRRGSKYGIVSMCIGGGMGAAGLFEAV